MTAAVSIMHEPAGLTSAGERRIIGLDVTRAVALIGVVVMNYHGYLNGPVGIAAAYPGAPFGRRLFDPWEGVLSTRFAATFVLVAGMGVTLLTKRARLSGDPALVAEARFRLLRRGMVLYVGGLLLDEWWPGTILFFYGAYFAVAAALFMLRTRWVITVGVVSAVSAAVVNLWRVQRAIDGHDTSWLEPYDNTPRGLVLRTLFGSTHPLLPWLAFLCAGIVFGRSLGRLAEVRWRLAGAGAALVAVTYAINHLLAGSGGPLRAAALSTRPFDRGLLYTIGTLGSSVAVFCVVSWAAERTSASWLTQAFQRAGQMTLTLYVAHVLVFKALVDWSGNIGATGLDTALTFAVWFWALAIAAAAMWHWMFGQGPLERLYRLVG